MEQAFSADVLGPLGVGFAALVIAVLIVVVRVARARGRTQPATEPTHADWTGESVGELPAPRPAPEVVRADRVDVGAGSVSAAASEQARPRTVADAVAVREADTAPLPVQSDVLLARARAHRAAAERAAAIQAEARRAAAEDSPVEEPGSGLDRAEDAAAGAQPASTADAGSLADRGAAEVEADARDEGTSDTSDTLATPDAPDTRATPDISATPTAARPASAAAPADIDAPAAAPVSGAAGPTGAAPGAPTPYARAGAVGQERTGETADDAVAPADERPTAAQLAALGAVGPGATAPEATPDQADAAAEPAAVDHVAQSGTAEVAGGSPEDQPESDPRADERPTVAPDGLEPLEAERPAPEEAGSSRTVAAAVQHALAARARAAQPNGVLDPRRGDARDRLLAVLLDDPVRAVGATVDLQSRQEELSRLAEEMRTRRDELGDAVRRLAAAGLGPDQVATLAGLDRSEVDRMLDQTRP